MRGRIGCMAGPNEPLTFVMLLQAVLANVAPVGVAVVFLVMRDRRGRFSLSMLLVLEQMSKIRAQ